jgi:hypothetical protein
VTTDTHELAWAAGFFDGEGSSSMNQHKRRWKSAVVSMGQTDREPLDRFDRATSNIGAVRGPYPMAGNRRPMYEWRVIGIDQCQLVMDMLWPWLCSIKREQWTTVSQAVRLHKQELAQTQIKKRRSRAPYARVVTNNQLEQILRVIEPWRFKE